MANEKTKRSLPAAIHAALYSACFLPFHPSPAAYLVILATHFLIDRFRIARYLVWAKNLCPRPFTATGFPADRPAWMAVWLLIVVDNVCHVVINGLALAYL